MGNVPRFKSSARTSSTIHEFSRPKLRQFSRSRPRPILYATRRSRTSTTKAKLWKSNGWNATSKSELSSWWTWGSAGSKWVHGWTWGSRVPTPNESNATKFSTATAAKSAINGSIATWTSRKYGTTTATTTNESWIWSTATKSLLKRKNNFFHTLEKKKKKKKKK